MNYFHEILQNLTRFPVNFGYTKTYRYKHGLIDELLELIPGFTLLLLIPFGPYALIILGIDSLELYASAPNLYEYFVAFFAYLFATYSYWNKDNLQIILKDFHTDEYYFCLFKVTLSFVFLYLTVLSRQNEGIELVLFFAIVFQMSALSSIHKMHERAKHYLNDRTIAMHLITKIPYDSFSDKVKYDQVFSFLALGLNRADYTEIPDWHNQNLEIALLLLEQSNTDEAFNQAYTELGFGSGLGPDYPSKKINKGRVKEIFNWIDPDLRTSERFRIALDLLANSSSDVVDSDDWSVEHTQTRWADSDQKSDLERIVRYANKLVQLEKQQLDQDQTLL